MVSEALARASVLAASSWASVERDGATVAAREVSTVVLPFTSPGRKGVREWLRAGGKGEGQGQKGLLLGINSDRAQQWRRGMFPLVCGVTWCAGKDARVGLSVRGKSEGLKVRNQSTLRGRWWVWEALPLLRRPARSPAEGEERQNIHVRRTAVRKIGYTNASVSRFLPIEVFLCCHPGLLLTSRKTVG